MEPVTLYYTKHSFGTRHVTNSGGIPLSPAISRGVTRPTRKYVMVVRHVTKRRNTATRVLLHMSRERGYLQRRKIAFDVSRSSVPLRGLVQVVNMSYLKSEAVNLTVHPCT